ncbi:MAG TPA: hypothetical protein VFK09_08570, partial [Gemmatimonadales bacterium]|nr:hypothetical protein [Gemmatimonadales bacterium]
MGRLGMRSGAAAGVLLAAALSPARAAAQAWNTPDALALVERGIERREEAQADSALRSYHTSAHGFVFFLAQIGERLSGPPRLIKADELKVEVYWQAPDRSKQIIRAWRDGRYLPTGISYHRDHLGIVTNNFGDLIRIGEGDEVRDAVHPLSPAGRDAYDFALGDSLAIRGPRGEVRVREMLVRPRSFDRPLVVGTLYLDAATAELVRFRFSFTAPAYIDRQLEGIDVVLENSLQEGRFWLPYRQEIEIRRRAAWLDFPVRWTIRGRWEIGDYDLDAPIPPEVLAGPAYGGLRRPQPDDSSWGRPLAAAIADEAPPINREELGSLRTEVQQLAGERALDALPSTQLAAGSLSDVVHVNRVQGLALGAGARIGLAGRRLRLKPSLGFGTSDDRVTGGLAVEADVGATTLAARAERRVRDFSDRRVIAPAVNSLLAQEAGKDYGDYVLLDDLAAEVRARLSPRLTGGVELAIERSRSLDVTATPASGTYRPNPALGAGTYRIARLRLERQGGGVAVGHDLDARLALEAGDGPTSYLRAAAGLRGRVPLGRTALLAWADGGIGSDGLPAYRSFVLGGRGTLVGEPFRAYGGRSYALAHLEWRVDVPVPELALGSFASTGRSVTLAP